MRFMIILKATRDSEAGAPPSETAMQAMADYYEEMARAGALVDAGGLYPSATGWRVTYRGGERSIVDGPFAETKELVGGYTIIDVPTREEALAWTKRFPNLDLVDGSIEVRPLIGLEECEPSETIERFKELERGQEAPSTNRAGRVRTDRVTPFLWYEGRAREAAALYTALIPNSRIVDVSEFDPERRSPSGPCAVVTFELDGRTFIAFDGGPGMQRTPAISLFVSCATQDEIDAIWDRLADGGEVLQCGWVTDRFGVTWQVVPARLEQMLMDDDRARAGRVMEAMMEMHKLDLPALERAYAGR